MSTSSPGASEREASIIYALLAVAALAVSTYVVFPFRAGQVGYDSAASVLYFERLLAGRHLEGFVGATPKPFLTIVFGTVYALTGDWRAISWLEIGAFCLAVVLTAALAMRLAGPAAAVVAGIGTMTSVPLLFDVTYAYAVVWALVGWLLAALAVTAARPRYLAAGICLLLAVLARYETLVLVATIAATLVGIQVRFALGRGSRPPGARWLILIAFLAMPLQAAHDWLLTGEPLYTLDVPVFGSVGENVLGPAAALKYIVGHFVAIAPLVLLAVVGTGLMIRHRQWAALVGLAALGPGIAFFLAYLGFRRIYISDRYFAPADLAVVFASSIGLTGLRIPEFGPAIERLVKPGWHRSAVGLAAAAVGLFVYAPLGPEGHALLNISRNNLATYAAADSALPVIDRALRRAPGSPDLSAAGPAGSQVGPDLPVLITSGLLKPRLAVELRVPVTKIAAVEGNRLDEGCGYLSPGQFVYHDVRMDQPSAVFAVLETEVPELRCAIRIVPLIADRAAGSWFLEIDSATSLP